MSSIKSAAVALTLLGSLAGPALAQSVPPSQLTVPVAYVPLDQDVGPTMPGPTSPAGPSY